jgi:hypothetical protein
MNTSPREERAVAKTVSVDKEQEIETRLVLHEHYADWTKLMRTKLKRVTKFMEQLRSPDVDLTALRQNTLWDEDQLDQLADDLELLAMAYPEWQRPAWVKRFEGK